MTKGSPQKMSCRPLDRASLRVATRPTKIRYHGTDRSPIRGMPIADTYQSVRSIPIISVGWMSGGFRPNPPVCLRMAAHKRPTITYGHFKVRRFRFQSNILEIRATGGCSIPTLPLHIKLDEGANSRTSPRCWSFDEQSFSAQTNRAEE